jgi:outer membrane autotransporter protein
MLRLKWVVSQRSVAAVVAPLAFALSMGISHHAIAACTPAGPYGAENNTIVCNPGAGETITTDGGVDSVTVNSGTTGAIDVGIENDTVDVTGGTTGTIAGGDGNDTITVSGGTTGAISGQNNDDKITINAGSTLTGTVNGNAGNDLIVINGGVSGNNVTAGTGTGSVGDTSDRIFMFDGTITGGEVQIGSGQNNFFFFMGGTIQPNGGGAGSVEINRGSRNSVLVFDGGTLTVDEGIEFQSGNAGLVAGPKDPTIYFRSGTIEAEEIELVATDFGGANPTNVTVIFDPINSKDPAFFQALANAASNGSDPTLSTANLNAALFSAPENPDADPQMIVKSEEISFGDGNDTLIFDGAINFGDEHHNLVLQGEEDEPGEFEITEFGGGGGDNTLTVTGGSKLMLGEVEDFGEINVFNQSTLILSATSEGGVPAEYEDIEELNIDGSSVVWVTGAAEFEADHIEIGGPNGGAEPMKVSNQYAAFDPGGVLMFGQYGGPFAEESGGDDDDDDDEAGGPIDIQVNIGPTTLINNGTVGTLNGIAGDIVTVNGGPYVAASPTAKMVIDTQLGGSNSPTDHFNFTYAGVGGPVQGNTTTVYVNNVGGIGALTGQGPTDGIVIVSAPAGFAPNAFQLGVNQLTGKQEVLAGAFSYRLFNSPTAALLQSDLLDQVPAYAIATSVAQRYASAGLGTLYKRMGEVRLGRGDGKTVGNAGAGMWVRGFYNDSDVSPETGFAFSQENQGVMGGADIDLGSTEGGHFLAGLFGGYGTADAGTSARIWGVNSSSKVDLNAYSFGFYGSYYEGSRPGTGLYVDGVFKVDITDYNMTSVVRSTSASTDGYTSTVSGETGYGFNLGGNLTLQPQAQLSYISVSNQNYQDNYGVKVGSGVAESLVGRASLQLQGNYGSASGGWFAPYVIGSVLSDFLGDNETAIGRTPFKNDMGLTWYEAGGGVTAELGEFVSLYGSAEYSFGDIEGWGGTGGVKARW